MSEYLDRPLRTPSEALADLRVLKAKQLLAATDRLIKLTREMHELYNYGDQKES